MKKYLSITIDVDTIGTLFPEQAVEDIKDDTFVNGLQRFLDIFNKYGVKATLFVVGKDLLLKKNIDILKLFAAEGHELANHTMNHIQGFYLLPEQSIIEEITNTENIIEETTGVKICGFRAPGWNADRSVLKILAGKNYLYDASVFPTIVMPAAKLTHYLKTRRLPKIQRVTMGPISNMFARSRIHRNGNDDKTGEANSGFFEVPLTTSSVLRLPFFGTMVFEFGMSYFNLLYRSIRKQKFVNFSLHLAELADKNNDFDPSVLDTRCNKGYIPKCLHMEAGEKLDILEEILQKFSRDFEFLTLKNAVEYFRKDDS